MSAQVQPHMSPAQAAQVAGVSRWSIMRAIKAHKLQAVRDNRNGWRIAPDDLAVWCSAQGAHSVRIGADAQGFAHTDLIADLREKLAAADLRAAVALIEAESANRARDQAESDRDRWRDMAETLAASRRWRFWPWP